jgi:hypothetical protein
LGWKMKSLYVRAALQNRVTISDPGFQQPTGPRRRLWRRYVLPYLRGSDPRSSGLLPPRLQGARLTSIQITADQPLREWRREARRDGFGARAYFYACDEPRDRPADWRRCRMRARAARRAWPRLPVLMTATLQEASRFAATRLVDILVPIINQIDDRAGMPYAGDQRGAYDGFLGHPGKDLWLYLACASAGCGSNSSLSPSLDGWASYAIDQPASEQRAMGFLSYEYGASGELYYRVDERLRSAWTNQYAYGGNGDGTLFYPGRPALIGGRHEIPIESIRLKRIRDGFEDYEYLRLLERKGLGPQAMVIARSLFPTPYETAVTSSALETARGELASLAGG